MGADERFKRAKAARERNEFDGRLAQAVKGGDERAMPSDKFGLTIRPGVLVMHFSAEPTPPIGLVTEIQPVLDPRAPAGMLRMRVVYDIFIPAGVPNPALLVVGDAPQEEAAPAAAESTPEVEIVKESDSHDVVGPKLVLTDAQ